MSSLLTSSQKKTEKKRELGLVPDWTEEGMKLQQAKVTPPRNFVALSEVFLKQTDD